MLCPMHWDFLEIAEGFLKEATPMTSSGTTPPGQALGAPTLEGPSPWHPLRPCQGPWAGFQFCVPAADGCDLA